MADVFAPIPHLAGAKVNKTQLSEVTGATIAEIDKWVRDGAPCERSGAIRSPLTFDVAQVLAWKVVHETLLRSGPMAARIAYLQLERDALQHALTQSRTYRPVRESKAL